MVLTPQSDLGSTADMLLYVLFVLVGLVAGNMGLRKVRPRRVFGGLPPLVAFASLPLRMHVSQHPRALQALIMRAPP